jgi:hypothetical protein
MGRTNVGLPLRMSLVFGLTAISYCSAQQAGSLPLRASLLTSKSDLSKRTPVLVAAKGSRRSWDRFETEFGLQQSDPTFIRGNIRRAKYGLDVVAFTATSVLDGAERALELEYDHGMVHRVASMPAEPHTKHARPRAFDDTRLKFDFDLTDGKPHVGVRLVIPFGN